eukprot:scaffold256_cov121-Isochrysis_galbana.AAC.4
MTRHLKQWTAAAARMLQSRRVQSRPRARCHRAPRIPGASPSGRRTSRCGQDPASGRWRRNERVRTAMKVARPTAPVRSRARRHRPLRTADAPTEGMGWAAT